MAEDTKKQNTDILTTGSLQNYFFSLLEEYNEQILSPLPQEMKCLADSGKSPYQPGLGAVRSGKMEI